jgi:hypothetical protein
MSRRGLAALLAALAPLVFAAGAMAQWVPSGALAKVRSSAIATRPAGDCGRVAARSADDLPLPAVVDLVRKKDPGAEQFYLVHEYGHIALADLQRGRGRLLGGTRAGEGAQRRALPERRDPPLRCAVPTSRARATARPASARKGSATAPECDSLSSCK